MRSLPDIVNSKHFPDSVRIIYMKMQASLSMRGVVEGLSELLEELEWCKETSAAYQFYAKRLRDQEARELQYIKDAIKWCEQQFKVIKYSLSKKQQIYELVEPIMTKQLEAIQKGQSSAPTYLQAMVDLLQYIVIMVASYGEEESLKSLGPYLKINISLPVLKDPLEHVKEEKIILPFTVEGEKIQKVLGKGFIKARVLPPTENYNANRYFIDQGMVPQINWPISIKKIMTINLVDWRITLDASGARCLHALNCYSGWRDWLSENQPLGENPKGLDLNRFYNQKSMREHILDMFSNPNHELARNEIFSVLDRFLALMLYEKLETRGKHNNKNRAERYALRQVKAILLPKSSEERSQFTRDMVIGMIMNRVEEEDLSFNVTKTNCKEACISFENSYDWPKKRHEDKKPRAKRVK